MSKQFLYISFFLAANLTFSFQAFGQSKRLQQFIDDNGIYVSASAPADTTLTWRNTTNGQSYFWSVENQAWTVVKFNYDFQSYTDILMSNIPIGATARANDLTYTIVPSAKTGYPIDSIWTIPTNSGYAIEKRLFDLNDIVIPTSLIGDTTQNNYILEKAATTAKTAATNNYSSTIQLPSAYINFTHAWKVTGKYSGTSVKIKGAGNSNNGTGRTTLNYIGADTTAVYISDMGNTSVSDMVIITKRKYAVFLDTFIFNVRFSNVDFASIDTNTTALVELNSLTNSQISEVFFDNCRFVGPGAGGNTNPGDQELEYGIRGGTGNNKGLYVNESNFLNIDTAIFYNAGGILDIRRTNFANNFVDIAARGNRTFCASNYSENTRRFYVSQVFSGMIAQTLINNYVAGNPYENIMVWGGGGLSLIGNNFDGGTDSLNRVKWDVPSNADLVPVGGNNSRKLFAINNFFKNCTNTPGEKWLINGSNVEPTNVSKSIKAWGNRGGQNNSNGIQLDDYFAFWDTDENGIYTPNDINITGYNITDATNYFNLDTLYHTTNFDFVPADPGLDTLTVGGTIRVRNQFILGQGAGSAAMYLCDDLVNINTSAISFNGKHIVAGFDIGIRGVQGSTRGIAQSSVIGSSGLGINNYTEAISITNTGLIGMGTIPTEKLQVNGNCVISGIIYLNTAKTVGIFTGTGSPEGAVTASIGSVFHRTDGGAGTSYYVKESGTGNTGWVAK